LGDHAGARPSRDSRTGRPPSAGATHTSARSHGSIGSQPSIVEYAMRRPSGDHHGGRGYVSKRAVSPPSARRRLLPVARPRTSSPAGRSTKKAMRLPSGEAAGRLSETVGVRVRFRRAPVATSTANSSS
jgi:hypothetical protein